MPIRIRRQQLLAVRKESQAYPRLLSIPLTVMGRHRSAVPAVPKDQSKDVLSPPKQMLHGIATPQHPAKVIRPTAKEHVLRHRLTVQLQFRHAQHRHVQLRRRRNGITKVKSPSQPHRRRHRPRSPQSLRRLHPQSPSKGSLPAPLFRHSADLRFSYDSGQGLFFSSYESVHQENSYAIEYHLQLDERKYGYRY